jgi:hypothetical protein
MAIGTCDCCDRRNVPGSVVNCPGEPFACHICQGDHDPDPYGELGERIMPCSDCNGDGVFDCWSHYAKCSGCDGAGSVAVRFEPITLSDLETTVF